MFFVVVFVGIAMIAGAAVLVGIQENANKARRDSPRALSNKQKLQMTKVAGVFPGRKEN